MSKATPVILATLLLAALSCATPTMAAGSSPTAVSQTAAKQRRSVFDRAKALFKEGDFAGGEAALLEADNAPPSSAAWYKECASNLLVMSGAFRHDRNAAIAAKLVQAAMLQLQAAQIAAASDPKSAAGILTMEGSIQERLLTDRKAAEASYAAAVSLASSNASQATVALAQMQAEDAVIANQAKSVSAK